MERPKDESEKTKIINPEIEEAKKVREEAVKNNEVLLQHSFSLLRNNIDLLKDSEKWIKEMIAFSKKNAEQDIFFREHEQQSSFSDQSYTVGDVEKEIQNIEEIKNEIKGIHDFITESQLDTIKEQESLRILTEMENEFREIMTHINFDQQN